MASLTLHCTPTLTLKKRVSRKLKGQSFILIVLEQGYTTEEADEALRGPFIALNGQEDSKMLIYVRTAGVNSPDMKPLSWVWRTAKEDMAKGTGEERTCIGTRTARAMTSWKSRSSWRCQTQVCI